MSLAAGGEELLCLIPLLVSAHPLADELIGDPLDNDLHFRYFWVEEALGVASKGLLHILEEHQDALHAAGGHVEIDIPEGIALVFADFEVAEHPVIEECKTAFVLVGDHSGQLWLSDHVILQTDVLDAVRGVGITCSLDHAAVVVKGKFILEAISQRALVERHVAFQQLEIKLDVEAVAERIGDGFVSCNCLIFISSINPSPHCILVARHVNALVLVIFPLWSCFREMVVTVVNITVVDGHHLVAREFYSGLFYDGAA